MTIPSVSNYPNSFDSDQNLFLVHDSIRMRLAEDYNPGDTTIFLEGDPVVMRKFPQYGLITLTEQCDEPDLRAISFFYSSIDYTNFTIGNLEILPEFTSVDSIKPKRITHVTQNVMSSHHNLIKDGVIAIEEFVGTKGTTDLRPLGPTMEGRINYLRKLVLSPKAYFTSDKRIGLTPLTVTFEDLSFRLGTDGSSGPVTYLWDFGDHSSVSVSLSSISEITSNAISCVADIVVDPISNGVVSKTYCEPGIYDVTLTVTNEFGSDTMTFPDMINPRIAAPDPAIIQYITQSGVQNITSGGHYTSGSYIPPVIRSPVDTTIEIKIPTGANPDNPGHSYGGEVLDTSNNPIDPIKSYSWKISDDLSHPSSPNTISSFSIGGLYDLVLRTDTEFGAYRITSYPSSLDIVEKFNLWLFVFQANSESQVVAYEYGLLSETFKALSGGPLNITRNSSFLDGYDQMQNEFGRNIGFAPRTTLSSGDSGDSLIFYASGRNASDLPSSERINFVQFNGFTNTYSSAPGFARPWNWANFNSDDTAYFLFGAPTSAPSPNTSPSNPNMTKYSTVSSTYTSTILGSPNFANGAQELLTNISQFDDNGNPVYGNFSVYRSAWKDGHGYIARNDNIGSFFRIKSFYRTEGTISDPVQTVKKLSDMVGPTKTEGELVSLASGIYFFNNSGSISAYNDQTGNWETTGPGSSSLAFRSVQDTSVTDFDDTSNTLLAASDGDQRAYLSYDYSVNAFVKFNALDLTFTLLRNRPSGNQFCMGIY